MLNLFTTKAGIWSTVVIAEAGASIVPPEFAPLANLGAIGLVLGWFMLRSEPRQRKLEEAMDRQTRMNGYVLIALESLSAPVKKQIDVVIKEAEDAELLRKGGKPTLG